MDDENEIQPVKETKEMAKNEAPTSEPVSDMPVPVISEAAEKVWLPDTPVLVTNLTNHMVHLESFDRDSCSIMPRANRVPIHYKFISWVRPNPNVIKIIDNV